MNWIKNRRLELGISQAEVAESLKQVEARVDSSMVSRYEGGVCLPTPAQLKRLCEELKAEPLDLYERDALRLLPPRKRSKETRVRKSLRMDRELWESLPEDLLKVCGFSTWQEWYDWAIQELLRMYDYASKSESKEGSA